LSHDSDWLEEFPPSRLHPEKVGNRCIEWISPLFPTLYPRLPPTRRAIASRIWNRWCPRGFGPRSHRPAHPRSR
jgi:hypothetical protein